jgi:NAD(P)-dependent dehydrogenase (short-subunit alcohol dehydrogenase family)
MSELRFDGRTAVVTGAGRGIGAAVARLLAARGARVVVNDLGGDVGGTGHDSDPADQVAASIRAAGGRAMASYADISTEDGAQSAVGAALTEFGGLDILVNCAGILRPDNIDDIDLEGFQRVTGVHVRGSLLMARAAWPQMKKQEYGRVVLTISAGFLGSPGALSYATGKGGIVSLGRSLARSGAAAGIKVNLFMPSADTRMIGISSIRNAAGRSAPAGAASGTGAAGKGAPEDVAPLAAFLAHEQVPVSGEMFSAANANVSRLFIAETRGFSAPGHGRVGLEDLRDHWQQVMDTDGYAIPADSAAHGRFKSTGAV